MKSNDFLIKLLIKKLNIYLFFGIILIVVDFLLYKFIYKEEFYTKISSIIENIKFVFFILLGMSYFMSVISSLNSYVKKTYGIHKMDHAVMLGFLKIIVVAIAALCILQNFGIEITSVLAFSGVGGVIAGLAAREFLANMFGFVGIIMDKTFKVGDKISSPDKKISGLVEDIGLRCTRIITNENRPIHVPNSLFSTIIVQNDSNVSVRFMSEKIMISCSGMNVLTFILSSIKNYFMQNEYVNKDFDVLCNVSSVGNKLFELSIDIFINAKKRIDFLKIKEDIIIDISKIICDFDGKMLLYDPVMKTVEKSDSFCMKEEKEE